jgi:DNA-directed RNA polymerase specialized sigma24 family protein
VAVSATLRASRQARARREEQLEQGDAAAGEPLGTFHASLQEAPDSIAERREWIHKIDAAMGRLRESRRLAVGLHLQGMTTREIGELLGWSEPKARNSVHRGLNDLRRHLRAEGIEYGR